MRQTKPKLPRNSEVLIGIGALKFMGPRCGKGHDGLRYAKSNRCVYCSMDNNEVTFAERSRRRGAMEREIVQMVSEMKARKSNADLAQIADRKRAILWYAIAV